MYRGAAACVPRDVFSRGVVCLLRSDARESEKSAEGERGRHPTLHTQTFSSWRRFGSDIPEAILQWVAIPVIYLFGADRLSVGARCCSFNSIKDRNGRPRRRV